MEYDPHGTELLDQVNHYVAKKQRIWATRIRKGLDACRCDTDLFVLLSELNESESAYVVKQAEELALSMVNVLE